MPAEITYDSALRQVIGNCVADVPNADVAVSSCASILEGALLRVQLVEALSASEGDPIVYCGRWMRSREQINSEMCAAMAELRRVIHAMRSVCPSADNQLTQ